MWKEKKNTLIAEILCPDDAQNFCEFAERILFKRRNARSSHSGEREESILSHSSLINIHEYFRILLQIILKHKKKEINNKG